VPSTQGHRVDLSPGRRQRDTRTLPRRRLRLAIAGRSPRCRVLPARRRRSSSNARPASCARANLQRSVATSLSSFTLESSKCLTRLTSEEERPFLAESNGRRAMEDGGCAECRIQAIRRPGSEVGGPAADGSRRVLGATVQSLRETRQAALAAAGSRQRPLGGCRRAPWQSPPACRWPE
jgi:hypothetical protein